MTDLTELESREAEEARALRTAQRRLSHGEKGAADEVRERREALQLVRDRLEGAKEAEREATEAEAAAALKSDGKAREKVCRDGEAALAAYVIAATKVERAANALGKAVAEFRAAETKVINIAGDSVNGRRCTPIDAIPSFTSRSFNSPDTLILSALRKVGIHIPGHGAAASDRGLLRWSKSRAEAMRAALTQLLDDPEAQAD